MVLKRLLLLVIFLPMLSFAETVILRADYWYPFNGYPNSSKPGFMIDIAKLAFADANITVDYQLMPWGDALTNAENGNIDCLLGASKFEGRNLLYPKNSFGMTSTGFFARFGELKDFRYQGLASIRELRIGMVKGAIHIEDLAFIDYIGKYKNTDKVYLSDEDRPLRDLMAKLLDEKIDLIIETPVVFQAIAQEQRLSLLFDEVGGTGKIAPVYIACSKTNPRSAFYLQLLDKKIESLRASGELNRILKRYGTKDWQ